ncbi:hypothetical protein [Roseburia faecis]|uniref:hypothetical protein n=1 Tax=Roseburia faecis TaxID=301302 RepID=UPI003F96E2C7
MRVEDLFVVKSTGKDAFTEMARVAESIRLGTRLSNGRCLKEELSVEEKDAAETYIMKKLIPEIREASKAKSRKLELSYEQEKLFNQLLLEHVYVEFHKYNKAQHLSQKDKTYEVSTFIDIQAKAAFRDYLIEERGLPVNTIQNMSLVSTAVAEIAMDKEIRPKEVTSDMVYEAVGKEKQISKEMIDILLGLLKGSVSIEEIPNFESTYSDGAADIEDEIELEMDPVTKAKMDALFVTFSDVELFILMKEFKFLGNQIGSMTAREMSYQDYFVEMVRNEKLGAKNIEFGSVKVIRPGRNRGAEEELLIEEVYYVKERYYNNKVAKIKKKLLSLAKVVEKDDLIGCLDSYCRNLWKERGLSNVLK